MSDGRGDFDSDCAVWEDRSAASDSAATGRDEPTLAQLRERIAFQETLLNALTDIGIQQMVITDGRIVHVGNRALAHEFGFTDAMIAAHPPLESILHPDDRARILDYHRRRLAGEPVPDTYELALLTRSGERREFEVSVSVVPGSQPPRVITVGRDITERKRAEAALEEARRAVAAREHQFRSLVENLPDLIVRYEKDLRRSYVSPAFERFTGHEARQVVGRSPLENWVAPCDEADRTRHLAALRQVADTGQATERELTSTQADDTRCVIRIRYVPELEKDGQLTGVLAVGQDISAQRAMEDRLRMTASVFSATREGIMITDASGHILEVNPAFSRITGYERGEALGATPSLLASGRHDHSFFRAMWSSLSQQGHWSGEIVNQRRNGERYTAQLDIAAVDGHNGSVRYFVGVLADVSRLKQHEAHLRHVAYHDDLTGLPNRLLLRKRLTKAIARAERRGHRVAVLYLDLDGFKPANDVHGHATGDQVLQTVARRLADSVRSSDVVARIGGDEFVAVLADVPSLPECEATAHRLLDAINEPIVVQGRCLTLSASMGASLFPDDERDPDILLRYADHAMYSAKAAGRNQLIFYSAIADCKTLGDARMIHDLRQALEQDQFTVHYQPIVDIATGRIVKAEALARWLHPSRGLVLPSVFIPVAENSGLIHAIGERVFRHAARVAREWNRRASAPPDDLLRIAVNRSPRQFTSRDGASGWLKHLSSEGISGRMLSIEITEGLLLEDRAEVFAQLEQMQGFGMTVSLDDFGTGYSSLSYLKKFDIDYIKIDRSFIRDISVDESDRAIVEAIIAIGRRLGIKLIAEGVETRAQAELLSAAGCDMAQGYFFAPPMPEEQFLAFALSGKKFDFEAAMLEFSGGTAGGILASRNLSDL